MQAAVPTAEVEIARGQRFAFGENWSRFLRSLTELKIQEAMRSVQWLTGFEELTGRSFLDVGSGSGLFSLAARKLGARVTSFDFDPASVACGMELRRRFYDRDPNWVIGQGSVLDEQFLNRLEKHDVVYSWGVLHHTGQMWKAVSNTALLVRPGGTLCLALYNDQGRRSRAWKSIKAIYCRMPRSLRWTILLPYLVKLWAPPMLKDTARMQPMKSWLSYSQKRGMSPWQDVVDWVGGFPFEVCKPEEVLDALVPFGFDLFRLRTCGGGHGCNEFGFRHSRTAANPPIGSRTTADSP